MVIRERKGILRIHLVRHGETEWNRESRLQGHTDIPLSEEGLRQAKQIAARLAVEPMDAIWSSDLSRAAHTAEEIARPHGLTVRSTSALRESNLGLWEGLTEPEIFARGDGELWNEYRRDSVRNRPPEGERLESVWDRLIECLTEIRETHSEGNVVIVGHGGSLRVILCDAIGASITSLRRIWLDNASLSLVEYKDSKSWVRLLNDTSHITGPQPPC